MQCNQGTKEIEIHVTLVHLILKFELNNVNHQLTWLQISNEVFKKIFALNY